MTSSDADLVSSHVYKKPKRQRAPMRELNMIDLPDLPLDLIFAHLNGRDAVALQLTCKRLLEVGSWPARWKARLINDYDVGLTKCKVDPCSRSPFSDRNRGDAPIQGLTLDCFSDGLNAQRSTIMFSGMPVSTDHHERLPAGRIISDLLSGLGSRDPNNYIRNGEGSEGLSRGSLDVDSLKASTHGGIDYMATYSQMSTKQKFGALQMCCVMTDGGCDMDMPKCWMGHLFKPRLWNAACSEAGANVHCLGALTGEPPIDYDEDIQMHGKRRFMTKRLILLYLHTVKLISVHNIDDVTEDMRKEAIAVISAQTTSDLQLILSRLLVEYDTNATIKTLLMYGLSGTELEREMQELRDIVEESLQGRARTLSDFGVIKDEEQGIMVDTDGVKQVTQASLKGQLTQSVGIVFACKSPNAHLKSSSSQKAGSCHSSAG